MLSVGLTGGIGAGKSMVSARLAELGAIVVDADELARSVVEPGSDGLAAVVREFGAGVLDERGALDRRRMADLVFGDPAARGRLESIVHPLVRTAAATRTAAAPADAVVINEIPLLVETGRTGEYDLVVVVEAPMDARLRRLAARGLSEADATRRIAAQASDLQRRAAAGYLLDNDGTPGELRQRTDRLWHFLLDKQRDKAERR